MGKRTNLHRKGHIEKLRREFYAGDGQPQQKRILCHVRVVDEQCKVHEWEAFYPSTFDAVDDVLDRFIINGEAQNLNSIVVKTTGSCIFSVPNVVLPVMVA